jgi:hypothetical protein
MNAGPVEQIGHLRPDFPVPSDIFFPLSRQQAGFPRKPFHKAP